MDTFVKANAKISIKINILGVFKIHKVFMDIIR